MARSVLLSSCSGAKTETGLGAVDQDSKVGPGAVLTKVRSPLPLDRVISSLSRYCILLVLSLALCPLGGRCWTPEYHLGQHVVGPVKTGLSLCPYPVQLSYVSLTSVDYKIYAAYLEVHLSRLFM